MPVSRSLSRRSRIYIKLVQGMMLIALIAFVFVMFKSCQQVKPDITRFAKGSLKRLEVKAPPQHQPSTKFNDINDRTWQLADFKGQPVLLNVWATWCTPCVKELPSLDALQAKYKDDFLVVTVSMDRDIVEAESFFKTKGIENLTVYHDPSLSIAGALGAAGLPISVFYTPNGAESARVSGDVDWMSAEVDRYLAHWLGR